MDILENLPSAAYEDSEDDTPRLPWDLPNRFGVGEAARPTLR